MNNRIILASLAFPNRYRLALISGLLLAAVVIADPSTQLVLPSDTVDTLSDRIYQNAGIWRPEPTPNDGFRDKPRKEKQSRIQWGYDSVYDSTNQGEQLDMLSTGPTSSGPRPATLFRWSF